MANPKNNAKLTGDTHLPDAEADDLPVQSGKKDLGPQGRPGTDPNPPGRAARKAGVLIDDAPDDQAEPGRDTGRAGG